MHRLFRRPLIALVLAYCCVLLVLNSRGYWRMPADHPLLSAVGVSTAVVGTVCAAPDQKPYGIVFDVILDEPAREKIRVTAYGHDNLLRPGDRVALRGEFRRPSGPRRPGGFDYAQYLSRQRIYFTFAARDAVIVERRKAPWYRAWPYAVRTWMVRAVTERVRPATAAVLVPMLIGDTSGLDPDTKTAFMDAGVMHILVVSGMNVGYCALLFFWLFRIVGLRRRLAALATIPCIIMYVLVTGANPPVVRAGIMAVSLTLALALSREPLIWQALTLAAGGILVFNPQALFTASFQLSFAATIGIVYLYPVFMVPFKKIPRPLGGVARAAGAVFAASAAAQLAVLPLMAAYFNRISVIGFASNLFIVPLTGVITIAGGMLIAAAAAVPFLTVPLAAACDLLIFLVTRCVLFFAHVPHATVMVSAPSLVTVMLYYVFWLTVFKPRWRLVLLATVLAYGGYQVYQWRQIQETVTITFLDVGAGDAIHIAFPGGRHWLIDGGGDGAAARVILPHLQARGVTRIDRVFITHPDPAHYGGLADVFAACAIGAVTYNPDMSTDPSFVRLMDDIATRNIPAAEAWAGDAFYAGACTMTVLSPSTMGASYDDNCLVMRLSAPGGAVLFSADASPAAQAAVARAGRACAAAYLQVPAGGAQPLHPSLNAAVTPRRRVITGGSSTEIVLKPPAS